MTRSASTTLGGLMLALGMAAAAQAATTCTTVARRGDLDPVGASLSSRFDEQVAVNGAGDVVFVGRAKGQRAALYRYPNSGPAGIVARSGDPAPGGSAFGRFRTTAATRLSLNSFGDAAFLARIALPGEAIVVDAGGVLEKAAQTTDPSPAGGFFVSFPAVSALNDAREIAFVGISDTGPSGIFRYDADTDALATVVDTTDTDTLGRPFCSFEAVGLSNLGLGFIATVGNPTCLSPVQGVFVESGGLFPALALVGDASPIGGAVYAAFLDAPEVGASISFDASVSGTTFSGTGIFSTAGPTKVVAAGDAAPGVGGVVRKLGGSHRQTAGGEIVTRLFLRGTTPHHGLFRYGTSAQALLVTSDAPPSPPFGALSRYRALGTPAIDPAGSFFAFRAKIRDTVAPSAKTAVLRCTP